MSVPDKLIAAKILAYDIRPYFAIGYHALIFVETPGIGTLAVDGKWRCYYDPETVEQWSVPHLATVLYHELCHLIRDHFSRAKRYGATLDREIWNVACFPAGTWTGYGATIDELEPDSTILNVMSRRYDGQLIGLRSQGGYVESTPEHPFFTRRRKHKVGLTPVRMHAPAWVAAKDIRVGDFICVPKLELMESDAIDLTELVKEGTDTLGRATFGNRALTSVPITEDTAWLIGLYIAEGSASPHVRFALDTEEMPTLGARVQQIAHDIGASASVSSSGRSLSITLGVSVFGRWLKQHCGRNAHEKHIPRVLLCHSNARIRRAVLQGILDGDGSLRQSRKTYTLGTVSEPLVRDAVLLLAQDGIGCSVSCDVHQARMIGTSHVMLPSVINRVAFRLEEGKPSTRVMNGRVVTTRNQRWRADEHGVWYPVKRVQSRRHVGTVFNLSTVSHTYVAGSYLVHNCDAAINDGLLEEIAILKVNVKNPAHRHEGFPGVPVTPSALKLPDNELEEFYYTKLMERKEAGDKGLKQLMEQVPKIPGCGDCGSCAHGVPAPYEPPTEARGTGDDPAATGLSTAEVDLITQQIAHDVQDFAGRQAGKIPGGWDRWATEKLTPKVNYMRWLRSTISNAVAEAEGKQDYSWLKPARRQGAMGSRFKMPGMTGYKPRVGTGIDTSGSMTGKQLSQCIAETSGLLRSLGYQEKIVVASCDTKAHNVQTITRIDQIKLKGGGGTDMGVALATLTEYRPKLDIIILMTDCITPWPAERPKGAIVVVRIGEEGTLPPWPCHLVEIPDED
jgi:hypothetical protein